MVSLSYGASLAFALGLLALAGIRSRRQGRTGPRSLGTER